MSDGPLRIGGFVSLVYRLILNRSPDRTAFVDAYLALSREELDPIELIHGIVRSPERRQLERERPDYLPHLTGVVNDFQDGERLLARMLGPLRGATEQQVVLSYLQGELALSVGEFSLAESFFKRTLGAPDWELFGRIRLAYARVRGLGIAEPGAVAASLARLIGKMGLDEHLTLLHHARLDLVSRHLPVGNKVLDLGGVATPLYKLGYPAGWQQMQILDYRDPGERVAQETAIRDEVSAERDVALVPGDLLALDHLPAGAFDVVWAGQCIQALEPQAGDHLLATCRGLLKPGGMLCLDTPNRLITRVHLEGSGKTFVNPSHRIEYEPAELRKKLEAQGYRIDHALGICQMARTLQSGRFRYEDFLRGDRFTNDVDSGYFQYYRCTPV